MTYGTLYHARGHSHSFSHPTLFIVNATDLREHFLLSGVFYLTLPIPREAEDFTRGDRHFKHVPPPTYLICLSPKELYTVGSIQICEESASHSFHDKRSMLYFAISVWHRVWRFVMNYGLSIDFLKHVVHN